MVGRIRIYVQRAMYMQKYTRAYVNLVNQVVYTYIYIYVCTYTQCSRLSRATIIRFIICSRTESFRRGWTFRRIAVRNSGKMKYLPISNQAGFRIYEI